MGSTLAKDSVAFNIFVTLFSFDETSLNDLEAKKPQMRQYGF